MIAGLIAVFAAIVYKLNENGRATPPVARLSADAPAEGRIAVPPGHRLVGAALDGDHALLRLVAPDGASVLLLIDLTTGAELARHRLVEE